MGVKPQFIHEHSKSKMALWTPYADKALDLTKNKQESIKLDKCHDPNLRHLGHTKNRQEPDAPDLRFARISPEVEENKYYSYGYEQQVPVSQISPNEVWSYSKASSPQSHDSFEIDSLSDDVEYQTFERDAFRVMAEKNGGALLGNNPRMRRAIQTNQAADDSYRKQRERNNYAAKQSRDRRKLREVRLAFQVTFLKKKIADLRNTIDERVCLRCQQYR